MDYNEKVKYLKSYRDKDDRLTFINNQLLGIKAISYTQGGAGAGCAYSWSHRTWLSPLS